MSGNQPIRTCIGCRAAAPASTLLRVVAVHGVPTPDPRRRLPGRGAWLHPRVGCLDTAERRRAFGRALRLPPGTFDSTPIRLLLAQHDQGEQRTGSSQGREAAAAAASEQQKAGRPVVSTP